MDDEQASLGVEQAGLRRVVDREEPNLADGHGAPVVIDGDDRQVG